jgi:hypothetical protein
MIDRYTMRLPPAARALLPVLLALALAGCGVDSTRVLARVGSRTITVDDFVETARDKEGQYPGPADSAKALLLGDLVQGALVLHDAERIGLYGQPVIQAARAPIEVEEARKALDRRLVPADVPVSEGEVEELYAWRARAAHVRVIPCVSRGAAAAAAAELARGARFAEVADRFGRPGGAPPGGDLGYVLPGSLLPPLDRYLREGPLRTVIGPLDASGQGWFLLEVLERKERQQRPLDEQRVILRDMLRQRKVWALRLLARQSLRTAYDVRPEPGGAQAMFTYFNQSVGDTSDRDLEHPAPAQRAIVLARYRAGGADSVYTLGDATTDLLDYGRERPDMMMIPAIENWIEDSVILRVTVIEAKRRRLLEEPEIRRRIDRRVDGQVLDLYYNTEIAHGAEATPDDLLEAYERSRQSFQRLDSVELLVATIADSAAAEAVVAHGAHAPSLREAVAMAAPGAPVSSETVRYPGAPARWAPYQAAFMDASPHACLGPIPTRGGWLVAQVVSKQQGPQAFEQLPPPIVQTLRQQADEIARDRLLKRKVGALRQELEPEVHLDRLRAIPWPVAGADGSRRG